MSSSSSTTTASSSISSSKCNQPNGGGIGKKNGEDDHDIGRAMSAAGATNSIEAPTAPTHVRTYLVTYTCNESTSY